MRRALNVVGALSNVGARPYGDGAARDLHLAPEVLRERGLITRLRAIDLGDVAAPPYRDFTRPALHVRNEALIAAYSRTLARRVGSAIAQGEFTLVVGGDCSVVLACLLAARKKTGDQLGLVYVDAHADFAVSDDLEADAAASIALALATGRGRSSLARLAGDGQLVEDHRTALIGRRDAADEWPGQPILPAPSILEVPSAQLRNDDWLELAAITLEHVAGTDSRGFWIQLDADVMNPAVMPAVESPQPGGPTPEELIRFLTPLVRHPKALGMSLTTYDPALDPDRSCARQLIRMLEALLAPGIAH
jgi:arginase